MDALLTEVLLSVFFHGGDHQIHTVRRRHKTRVPSQFERLSARLDLSSLHDIFEDGDHVLEVLKKDLIFHARIDFLRISDRLFDDAFEFFSRHRTIAEIVDALDVFRQQDRPRFIDRKDILSIDNDQRIRILGTHVFRRYQMDTDHSRSVRIPGRVKDRIPVLFFIPLNPAHISTRLNSSRIQMRVAGVLRACM